MLVGAKRSQEEPGGARRSWDEPGEARQRLSGDPPGLATRSLQGVQGPADKITCSNKTGGKSEAFRMVFRQFLREFKGLRGARGANLASISLQFSACWLLPV